MRVQEDGCHVFTVRLNVSHLWYLDGITSLLTSNTAAHLCPTPAWTATASVCCHPGHLSPSDTQIHSFLHWHQTSTPTLHTNTYTHIHLFTHTHTNTSLYTQVHIHPPLHTITHTPPHPLTHIPRSWSLLPLSSKV